MEELEVFIQEGIETEKLIHAVETIKDRIHPLKLVVNDTRLPLEEKIAAHAQKSKFEKVLKAIQEEIRKGLH